MVVAVSTCAKLAEVKKVIDEEEEWEEEDWDEEDWEDEE
jgi:hypothetical protein